MNLKRKELAKYVTAATLTAVLCACSVQSEAKPATIHPFVPPQQTEIPSQKNEATQVGFDERTIIAITTSAGEVQMTLSEYLQGVLSAELPQSFSPAAMQAQAIASRTFALGRLEDGRELCDDFACCQAYRAGETTEQIRAAVAETDGLVLTYEDSLIEATFFSCSGGMTEAAVEVWGHEVPYLQTVVSPGEEFAPRYEETISLPKKTFLQKLQALSELDLTRQPLVGEISYTQGGGIRTIEIGGTSFSGLQMRSTFGLRSTNFEVEISGTSVRITTHGYGHRVGMSQYGAQAMALAGAEASEILAHYYPGTVLVHAEE